MTCDQQPLEQVVSELVKKHGLPIWFDRQALLRAESDIGKSVTANIQDVRLSSILNLLLRPHELDWIVDDEVLQITTRERACGKFFTRVYDVRFLKPDPETLEWPPQGFATSPWWRPIPANQVSGFQGPGGGLFGLPVKTLQQGFGGPQKEGSGGAESPRDGTCPPHVVSMENLVDALQATVDSSSWSHVGGEGSIRSYGGALVVRQTQAVQDEIHRLIEQLRALHQPPAARRVVIPLNPNLQRVVYPIGDYPPDELIGLITEFVSPETWKSADGQGSLQVAQRAIVVRQTAAVHEEIVKFLHQLLFNSQP
ncbi:MAG: hypothetical protein ACKV0T_10230 [Planctomycetales bacterium]